MVATERALSKVCKESYAARMELSILTSVTAHLAKLAVEQGMSHRAIAELLHVSHTAVQKMLRHEVDGISRERAERLLADEARAELRKANRAKLVSS